jgi:hypothetical protein
MAKIVGIDGMDDAEVMAAVQDGARFVVYRYCISIGVLSFKRSSAVYFLPADKSAVVRGLPYVALSLLLGWWGIPWGRSGPSPPSMKI